MCCFSYGPGPDATPVTVDQTNIFASRYGDRQVLVYEMTLSVAEEVAMILPIPVAPGAREATRFINLNHCHDFFRWLSRTFPPLQELSASLAEASAPPAPPLPVVQVGVYEASWVPSLLDMARLDARFRLPEDVWAQLPAYRDYGFAVFRLQPGHQAVHPMALSFVTREPERLFFPTVHIHDGTLDATAGFDHQLYYQRDLPGLRAIEAREPRMVERPRTHDEYIEAQKAQGRAFGVWVRERDQAKRGVKDLFSGEVVARTLGTDGWHREGISQEARDVLLRLHGIVRPEWHLLRRTLRGDLPNQDTWVDDGPIAAG